MKQTPGWDFAISTEVTIHRPARHVWRAFIGNNKDSWSNANHETVSGIPGEVGEVFTHAHTLHGVHLFYEAIKVAAPKLLVLKTYYGEKQTGARKLAGYEFITLNETGGHTTVLFQQALALPADIISPENAQITTESKVKGWARLIQSLKTVAESESFRDTER